MNNNFNNFNNMDDLFNQLMGGMRGYSSENRRYLINGREVTPEEFAHYRATVNCQEMQNMMRKCNNTLQV
jgi:ATP-dependent clp protease ATP-binding subunit clpL